MFSFRIALVVVSVASGITAEEFPPNNDASSGKQSSLGFEAIQGPKIQAFASVENDDFVKRAPMGFQGMRGKKESWTPEFADSYFVDEYFKRAPMGFQGMRGKKAMTDEDYYKRAAMGFQGMRGKKSPDFIFDEIDNARYDDGRGANRNMLEYFDEYEKRAPSMGFQGMRGKRQEFENEWAKRAPMGFQGMRGKKSLLAEINDLEKRAMMGFQGMRGKKSVSNIYWNAFRPERSALYPGPYKKQVDPKMKRINVGFVGSRGKRSDLDLATDLQEPLADDAADDLFLQDDLTDRINVLPLQFYKRSAYGYSGMRGKKIPRWEIRGKFVGVRGKKRSEPNNEATGNLLDNVQSNSQRIGVKTGSITKLDNQ